MALTDKQRRFVDAKAQGASNREAAEAAGYAASSAAVAGSRLAKNPEVIAELEMLMSRRNVNAKTPQLTLGDDDGGIDGDGEFLDCLPVTEDPLEWLIALMNEPRAKVFDRRNAAQTVVPYVHGKKGEVGKKELKAEAAKAASKGKFSAGKPPLSVVKG
ncbi:terminase small subunit [Pseudomonas sp. TTU2014-080ASC]|uniref:terminase small subunit n=1 Tax=Pseudomonas sp. TTU2014-080ASC TaxID=1729724 RepID=UPI000718A08A|nr:terminase small subunit [Pseudomonas sp. TTU2014-080ASC]KRW62346.1 hypothetical protein AO726_02675 [Pseudomonas sp. TTU2014-080ASC]